MSAGGPGSPAVAATSAWLVPGIVKVLDGRDGVTCPGPLGEPEEAFAAVAEMYGLSTP